MNILYILSENPVQKAYGALQRTNMLWEALKELGDVYAVYFDTRPESRLVDERLAAIGTMPRLSGRRNLLFRIQNRLPHDLHMLEFGPLRPWTATSLIDTFPGVTFDIVVCRYVNNYALYHIWDLHLPTLIDIDDHPLQLFDTFTDNAVASPLRPLVRKLLEWQMQYLERKVEGMWVSDVSHIDYLHNTSNVRWLMNIPVPAPPTYARAEMPKPYLLTVGAMDYQPNHRGVAHFLTEIWPLFHAQHPEMEYLIAGKDAPPSLTEQCSRTAGVRYLGYVPDLDELYAHCAATVVPIGEGSGTCIKTLESVARNVPCLTTAFGARGISHYCHDMKSIGLYQYSDAHQFLKAYDEATQALTDASLKARMSRFIAENHSYERFRTAVREMIATTTKHI